MHGMAVQIAVDCHGSHGHRQFLAERAHREGALSAFGLAAAPTATLPSAFQNWRTAHLGISVA